MSRGKEEHEARMARLQSFGKDLTRRAKSRCELCGDDGGGLAACVAPPAPREPDPGHCALLCGRCREAVERPSAFRGGEEWRCLAAAVWSEVPAVQVLAVRLLRRLEASQPWAREILDDLYLDPEIEEWVTKEV